MGALECEPVINKHTDIDEQINLQRMSDFASAILEGKMDVVLSLLTMKNQAKSVQGRLI